MTTYDDIIRTIVDAAKASNGEYLITGASRAASAIMEKPFLDALVAHLPPEMQHLVERPDGDTNWFDIRIRGIPINLKITTGTTADNAVSKQGIVASITGHTTFSQHMNWHDMLHMLKHYPWTLTREREREYHYLVVKKVGDVSHDGPVTTKTGKPIRQKYAILEFRCLRSILDVSHYRANPSNILQIRWDQEWSCTDHTTDEALHKKRVSLLGTIQTSLMYQIYATKDFAKHEWPTAQALAPARVVDVATTPSNAPTDTGVCEPCTSCKKGQ